MSLAFIRSGWNKQDGEASERNRNVNKKQTSDLLQRLSAATETLACLYSEVPQMHVFKKKKPQNSRWNYLKSLFLKRKRPSVFPRFSLQQAGLTVTHTQYANEPKKKKKKLIQEQRCAHQPRRRRKRAWLWILALLTFHG